MLLASKTVKMYLVETPGDGVPFGNKADAVSTAKAIVREDYQSWPADRRATRIYTILIDERTDEHRWGGWVGGFRDVAEHGRKPKLQAVMSSLCASMPDFARTENPEKRYRGAS